MASLVRRPIELSRLVQAVRGPERGGIACFVGTVRDHHGGRSVLRLAYSAYEPMAEAECERILAEVAQREPAVIALEHRLGELEVGEVSVAIAAAAAHRDAAFAACRYVIEELKHRVPIWKREFYGDGTVAWVEPDAARRAELSVERSHG